MLSKPPLPPLHHGLDAVAHDYDAFILDLWGVLHDGVQAYPNAIEGLRRLKAAGKTLLVLSNAPRRTREIAERMAELGITGDLYDHLMSSGEDTWTHLRARPCPWYKALGRRTVHIGPARDFGMRAGLDLTLVEDVAEADFILNTGPGDAEQEDISGLEPLLRAGAERGLPMVCANPDLIVMRGGEKELCAGAVAARYEELGGAVRYHGKPHRAIYDTCFKLLGDPDPSRVCAVGDTIRTDIAGANAVGVDSILITGGIHAGELGVRMGEFASPENLAALYARENERPTVVLPEFRW